MQHSKTIGILALFIALLPYAGVPGAWYRPVVFVFGLVIAFLAFRSFFKIQQTGDSRTLELPFGQDAHNSHIASDTPTAHA